MKLPAGLLNPDQPVPTARWIELLYVVGLILAMLIPPEWIFAGYVYASIPWIWAVRRRLRYALAGTLPVAYALIKSGYVPAWTLAALALGLPAVCCTRAGFAFAVLWTAALTASAVEYYVATPSRVPAGEELVVLGDSLCTFGLIPELEKTSPVPVRDSAQPGITAAFALKQLVPELEKLSNRTFAVELGGHDYLRGTPTSEIEATLDEILTRLRTRRNHAILVEIPTGFVRDSLGGIYRRLARKHDAALIPDILIRKFVLVPGLSNDGLHPSLEGSRLFAREIISRIQAGEGAEPSRGRTGP